LYISFSKQRFGDLASFFYPGLCGSVSDLMHIHGLAWGVSSEEALNLRPIAPTAVLAMWVVNNDIVDVIEINAPFNVRVTARVCVVIGPDLLDGSPIVPNI
jgi:hypothetical protein